MDDPPRSRSFVEEIQTAEFTLPEKPADREGELVATILASTTDGVQDARALTIAALRELEASGEDDARRARIHLALGQIIEQRLDDHRRAAHHYLEAARLAPSNLAAIRASRRLFWRNQNWSMVVQLLDKELGLVSAPPARARLLFFKGRVFEEWLLSSERAQACYEEALKLDPSNRPLLLRLRRLAVRRGEPQAALEICRRAAAATKDRKYRGLLLAEMGRILEAEGDLEAAIATYGAAFVEDPSLAGARAPLKRLYHLRGRWSELTEVLLTEGEIATDERERVHSYLAAARLCRDHLGQADRALEIFARVKKIAPDDPAALRETAELYAIAGRYSELCETYQQLIECLHDNWERVLTHYRLGQVLEERLGREDEAIIHYRRAVSLDPTYVPALQSLGKLYQRRGLWAELITMNAAEAETVPDGESRAARFAALAELCETQLAELPRAVELHRRALASAAHHAPSERALERLYTAVEDWSSLSGLLESQLEQLSGPAAGRQLAELGRLCEERLKDHERAIGFFRRALEHLPGDPALYRALQRLHTRAGRFEEVLAALDQEIAVTTNESLAITLRHKAAEICETRLQRVDDAIARYRDILTRAATHWPTLSALGRIYYRLGKWQEVLALYRAEVEQRGISAARLAALLYKMADLYLEQIGDEESALAAYNRALEANPSYLPALQAVARIYRRREDWERLLPVMRRLAEVQSSAEQKAIALCEIGELCETRLGQLSVAVQYFRQGLELAPGNDVALTALLRIFSAEGRWREVVELYQRALGATTDEDASLYLLKRMGEVWEVRLLNPARAIDCYEQSLAMNAEDVESLEALARLYRRVGDFERLANAYERLAFRAKDSGEAVSYLYEAASVLELHLPEHDTTRIYERIAQQSPDEVPALEALDRLYRRKEDAAHRIKICDAWIGLEEDAETKSALLLEIAQAREQAEDLAGSGWVLGQAAALSENWVVVRELRRIRERLGQWEHVAQSLEQEGAASRNRVFKVEALMRAATLYQDRFGDLDRAAAVLGRVLEVDPFHDEAAVRLEQILVKREAWPELVEALRRRLEAAAAASRPGAGNTAQAQIELLARMAWIQREHLQQPAEGIATLMRAVQLDPNHLPTLLTLGELHLGLEQWQEAVEAYSRIVAVSDDPDVLRSAHFRLGDLWSERIGDARRAISSYQNVLAIAPDDVAALTKLYELFGRSKDWENAADVLTRLIEVESEPTLLVEHHAALAEIQEKGFGDPRLAAEQLQHALAIDPVNEEILARFSTLSAHLGDWGALADAIRSFLVALPADQEGRGIQYRVQLGEILRRRLGRTAEALEQFGVVSEIDPTNVEARLATAAILAEEGRFEEALAEHRDVQGIDGLNVESLSQMCTIWSRMGNHEMAYAVAGTLVCLGEAQEAEEQLYRERRAKGVRLPQTPPEPALLDRVLVHPGENAAGRRLLAVLGEIAHRLRPARLADWNVTKADRLPTRSEDPIKALAREVGLLLGLEREVEIFISPTRSREMDLLLTDPPSLVVGAGVMGAYSSLEVRFWMGVLLSYLRHRTFVAQGLSGAQLGGLLRAATLAAGPGELPDDERGDETTATARLIQRALSRRGRRALEDASHALAAAREPNVEEWSRALQHSALRTGLFVVGDVETAFAYLRRTDPALLKQRENDLVSSVRRSELGVELIHFWLSEDYHKLRR
jgi:tetratricopeptide (TPR) repeat protein